MSFYDDRRVLVTGCTGFLGTWLTGALAERGADIVGLVRDYTPRAPFFLEQLDRKVTLVNGCVEDYALLERTLGEYEIDTVFHLAAQALVGVANRNPMATFEANVQGTWTLLEAVRRNSQVSRVAVSYTHLTLPTIYSV